MTNNLTLTPGVENKSTLILGACVPFSLAAISMAFTLSAFGADWYKGENLLAHVVPADQWDLYRDPSDKATSLWKRKGNSDDQYAVSVYHDLKASLSDVRTLQDKPGQQHCAKFESTLIEEQPVNGYQRMIWRTLCVRTDSSKSSILHLVVQGRDSFYHVQKMWRFDVPQSDVDTWSTRLKSILVCDTREKQQPCPEGYKRVK
jgi:hypothetical protein